MFRGREGVTANLLNPGTCAAQDLLSGARALDCRSVLRRLAGSRHSTVRPSSGGGDSGQEALPRARRHWFDCRHCAERYGMTRDSTLLDPPPLRKGSAQRSGSVADRRSRGSAGRACDTPPASGNPRLRSPAGMRPARAPSRRQVAVARPVGIGETALVPMPSAAMTRVADQSPLGIFRAGIVRRTKAGRWRRVIPRLPDGGKPGPQPPRASNEPERCLRHPKPRALMDPGFRHSRPRDDEGG